MKTYVRTETGSLYLIDGENVTKGGGQVLTWERLEETEKSGPLRTDGGEMLDYPYIKLGKPMILLCPPIIDSALGRIIMTTPVVEVRYVE